MDTVTARPAGPADCAAIDALHAAVWGGSIVAVHGRLFDLRLLPAFVAQAPDATVVGALCYEQSADALEVGLLRPVPGLDGRRTW